MGQNQGKIYTKAIVKVPREEHPLPIGGKVSSKTLQFALRFPDMGSF